MIKKYIIFSLVLVCVISNISNAQPEDAQFRSSFGLVKKLHKDFEISGTYELRFFNNVHQFQSAFISIGGKYKLNKHFSFEPDFRFGTSKYWDKSRWGIGFKGEISPGDFQLSLRGKYEYEYYRQSIPEIGQYPARNNFRVKFETKYKLMKGFKLFVSIEPMYRIVAHNGFFHRMDYIGGIDWSFRKHHSVSLSYINQPLYFGEKYFTSHIYGIKYLYELQSLKKDKKKHKSDLK